MNQETKKKYIRSAGESRSSVPTPTRKRVEDPGFDAVKKRALRVNYAVALMRSVTRAATSTSDATLMTAAPMKAA